MATPDLRTLAVLIATIESMRRIIEETVERFVDVVEDARDALEDAGDAASPLLEQLEDAWLDVRVAVEDVLDRDPDHMRARAAQLRADGRTGRAARVEARARKVERRQTARAKRRADR